MEEYWFIAPMSRLAIYSATLNFFFSETFHDNLLVARAKQLGRSMKKLLRVRSDRVTRLDLIADWAEKYLPAQSAGQNLTTSGTGTVRISSQGFFSSWSKLSPEMIASSRLVAPGSPRMISIQCIVGSHLPDFKPLRTRYESDNYGISN